MEVLCKTGLVLKIQRKGYSTLSEMLSKEQRLDNLYELQEGKNKLYEMEILYEILWYM